MPLAHRTGEGLGVRAISKQRMKTPLTLILSQGRGNQTPLALRERGWG